MDVISIFRTKPSQFIDIANQVDSYGDFILKLQNLPNFQIAKIMSTEDLALLYDLALTERNKYETKRKDS